MQSFQLWSHAGFLPRLWVLALVACDLTFAKVFPLHGIVSNIFSLLYCSFVFHLISAGCTS